MMGYAMVGKDTVGNYLVEDHGFVRYAFADNVRACALAVDPIIVPSANLAENNGHNRLSDVVANLGWDEAKKLPEVRRTLQRVGTEMGRRTIDDLLWVNLLFKQIHDEGAKNVVITDLRFRNEANAVHTHHGLVVRITRPGYEPVNAHISETDAIGEEDILVDNNRDLAQLRKYTDDLLMQLSVRGFR